MKADISANTFDPTRHIAGVVFGQGQALVDSVLNEQEQIVRHRSAQTVVDTIGAAGTPRDAAGFAVSVAPDGSDLLVTAGRTYVGGIACLNDPEWFDATVQTATDLACDISAPDGRALEPGQWLMVDDTATAAAVKIASIDGTRVTITAAVTTVVGTRVRVRRINSLRHQPDRFTMDPFAADPLDPAGTSPLTAGAYRVELDAWYRHLSPIEDPSIREVALGDAESATRVRVVWQLRLTPAGNVGEGSCALDLPVQRGMLTASTTPGAPSDDACLLPDEGGYRGLENQLYRVEVHDATPDLVVLKWQRDNASVASRVAVLGSTIELEDMGHDDERGFVTAAWVEVTDDLLELESLPSDLLAVVEPDGPHRTIELLGAPTLAKLARNAKARRWDGRIAIDLTQPAAADAIELERGLRVALTPGELRPGDYWTIPARTANRATAGTITWKVDASGGYRAEMPHGIDHHRASLALIDTDGTTFGVDPSNLRECRVVFPALTAIEAADVSVAPGTCDLDTGSTLQNALDVLWARGSGGGVCTVTATPGAGWESVFDQIDPGADAQVCFPIGDYPTPDRITVEGKGRIVLHGAGYGSAIASSGAETAISFVACAAVTLETLSVAGGSGTAGVKNRPAALAFTNCPEVVISRCRITCADHDFGQVVGVRALGGSLRVENSVIGAAHGQSGLLHLNGAHTEVVDTVVAVTTDPVVPQNPRVSSALAHQRPLIRHTFYSDLRPAAAEPGPGGGRVPITIGTRPYTFATIQEGRFSLPQLLEPSYRSMGVFQRAMDRVWEQFFSDNTPSSVETMADLIISSIVAKPVATLAEGIVIAGSRVGDVRITGSTIGPALQGIHVGASHSAQLRAGPTDPIGSVLLSGNTISTVVPPEGARSRHGIFVGSARRIRIEGNELSHVSSAISPVFPTDGIRVIGSPGPFLSVRDNAVEGYDSALALHLYKAVGSQSELPRMWSVDSNLLGMGTAVGADASLEGDLVGQVIFRANLPGPANT